MNQPDYSKHNSVAVKPKSNKLRNFIWIIAGVIIMSGLVFSASVINDNSGSFSNSKINDSGVFVTDGTTYQKAFARTADVVVCRGTSALDDLIKSFTCDVVCKSTDGDCNSPLNITKYGQNKTIYLTSGIYQINLTKINLNYALERDVLVNLADGQRLIGSGKQNTIIRAIGSINNISANLIGSNIANAKVEITDLQIDMNSRNLLFLNFVRATNIYYSGIIFYSNNLHSSVNNVKIINGAINSTGTPNYYGIGIDTINAPYSTYDNIEIDNVDFPLWITREYDNTESDFRFSDIYITNTPIFRTHNPASIYIETVKGLTLDNIHIINGTGILLDNGKISNVKISNLDMKNISGNGISIPDSGVDVNDILINLFNIDTTIGLGANKDGISLGHKTSSNIMISNGIIENCNATGIGVNLVFGKNAKISNVKVKNCDIGFKVDDGYGRSELIDVEAVENEQMGFQIQQGRCINCIAYNNHATGALDGGFRLDGAPNNVVELINPYCYDNQTSPTQTKCFDIFQSNKTIILNPRYEQMASNFSLNGAQYNFYSDKYTYLSILDKLSCLSSDAFNQRVVYNSTAGCKCSDGAWKCWTMT